MKRAMKLAEALEVVRKHGRGKDTEVAHVMPREKALLKAMGGRGSVNPMTGLKEYEIDGGGGMDGGNDGQGGGDTTGQGTDFGGQTGGYLESVSAPTSTPTLGDTTMQGGDVTRETLGPPGEMNVDRISQIMSELQSQPTAQPVRDIRDVETEALVNAPTNLIGPPAERSFMEKATSGAGLAGILGVGPMGPLAALMQGLNDRYYGGAARAFGGTGETGPFQAGLGPEGSPGGPPDVTPAQMAATPTYMRPDSQNIPDFLQSYLSPGLTELQQRALISTMGSQGVNPLFRSQPAQRFYASLLARELVNQQNQLNQSPYLLPIEQRYLSGVIGAPGTQPEQIYQGIRPLLA